MEFANVVHRTTGTLQNFALSSDNILVLSFDDEKQKRKERKEGRRMRILFIHCFGNQTNKKECQTKQPIMMNE